MSGCLPHEQPPCVTLNQSAFRAYAVPLSELLLLPNRIAQSACIIRFRSDEGVKLFYVMTFGTPVPKRSAGVW